MVKLSVCIEMFWKEQPMEERVRRAKRLGYPAFEFWGWKNKEIDKIRAAREETGLALAAMCLEPNFRLVDYGNDRELVEGTVESAKVARTLGCATLIATTGDVVAGETWETTCLLYTSPSPRD